MSRRISYRKCAINGCERISSHKGMCFMHYQRVRKRGTPLEIDFYEHMRGENNPNWNGGISEYPDHSLMKKFRKEVLEEAGYICEKCGSRADRIHHRDFNKSHQAKINYMPICNGCNLKFHPYHDSKYRRLYGLTLKDMVNKYGGSQSKYSLLESRGRLKDFLLAY